MAQLSYWRRVARPIIAEVIARVGTDNEYELRKALSEAYPFGEHRYNVHRIWCDEIRKQTRESLPSRRKPAEVAPGQLSFEL